MMYNNYGLNVEQVEFIVELMQDLYAHELIFQDFKRHEFTLNDPDAARSVSTVPRRCNRSHYRRCARPAFYNRKSSYRSRNGF